MAALVDKATSDMLIGPDWAMNMEICDIINHDPGAAKDVVKSIKKRLGHRNPKVQLLALTVLETIVKNCGVAVHQQVAEKDVLHEMVKIVKRKTDMHVRDKILVLLMSWQEAFGGPRGRYPQYYMAFEELRRMGVEFPDRPAERDAPIFTPPQTHPLQPVPGYGSPAHMPSRLEALMNNDMPGLSLTDIETSRGRVEVLLEMLNAVNPRDKQAVKDELIVELVEQCRSTQQRVMSLVNNTSDEELLRQGLGLNDELQKVLEKHDAIASGKALPKDPAPPPPAAAAAQTKVPELIKTEESRRSKELVDQAEAADPFVQLALPAPPTPTKSSSSVRKAADLIDLLSGDSTVPSAPTLPPVSPMQVSSNPFGPAFHAEPSYPAQQPQQQQQQPSFSTQQQQQQQQASYPTQQQQQQQPQTSQQQFSSSLPNGSLFSGQAQQAQAQAQQFGATYSQQYAANGTGYSSPGQQQYAANGTGFSSPGQFSGTNGAAAYSPQQQQGFSFPAQQYQAQDQASNYAAPWAAAQLSPQQQAMIYGSSNQGAQLSPQPAAPWAAQQMYGYGSGYGAYGQQYPYAEQYSYQYGAGSYYQNGMMGGQSSGDQLALVPVASSAGSGSGGGASKPADKLFEDLVDMQSLSSKFKSAGISSSLSRPGATGSL